MTLMPYRSRFGPVFLSDDMYSFLKSSEYIRLDVNNDNLDDLIVCDRLGRARLYVQQKSGRFRQVRSHRSRMEAYLRWIPTLK